MHLITTSHHPSVLPIFLHADESFSLFDSGELANAVAGEKKGKHPYSPSNYMYALLKESFAVVQTCLGLRQSCCLSLPITNIISNRLAK